MKNPVSPIPGSGVHQRKAPNVLQMLLHSQKIKMSSDERPALENMTQFWICLDLYGYH